MNNMNKSDSLITIEAIIDAPIETVWKNWTNPDDIIKWNNASHDWHTTKAENDLKTGGRFLFRMESKDGKTGFDFEGVYDTIKPHELIEYTISDGRKVKVIFTTENAKTKIVETFEAENENSLEMQLEGWQAILNNFKKYTEASLVNS